MRPILGVALKLKHSKLVNYRFSQIPMVSDTYMFIFFNFLTLKNILLDRWAVLHRNSFSLLKTGARIWTVVLVCDFFCHTNSSSYNQYSSHFKILTFIYFVICIFNFIYFMSCDCHLYKKAFFCVVFHHVSSIIFYMCVSRKVKVLMNLIDF